MIEIKINDKELEKRLRETSYIHSIPMKQLIKDSLSFFDIILHKVSKGEEIMSYDRKTDKYEIYEYKKYQNKEIENVRQKK